MPSGKNWIYFIYINLAFGLYMAGVFYFNQLEEIKANWPLYRCNPMYMPLADDVESNFTHCIQTMQSDYMGHLLQPLTFVTSSITDLLGGFLGEINMVRAMFDKIRKFLSSIIENVFGVFLNLVIEFQRITIGIKDLIGKTVGIMVSLMYVMDGSIKTMNSTWNGPPGQIVKALGKCFHPDTKIKLKNGDTKQMKNIDLGDILENGSIVEAVMKIDNLKNPVPLYELKGRGINKKSIYVTGSHLVFNNITNDFCKVENYYKSDKTTVTTDWFSCLITNDHKIQIENEIFWDWEDHFVKVK
jgi:hypothetical protein